MVPYWIAHLPSDPAEMSGASTYSAEEAVQILLEGFDASRALRRDVRQPVCVDLRC